MMTSQHQNQPEGRLTSDQIAAQLAIIASRLESIVSQMKGDVAEIKAWMGVKKVRSENPVDVEEDDDHGETQTHSSARILTSEQDPQDPDSPDTRSPHHSMEPNSTRPGSVRAAPGFVLKKKLVDGTIGSGMSNGPTASPSPAGVPRMRVASLLPNSLQTCFMLSVGSWTHNLVFQHPTPMTSLLVIKTWGSDLQPHSFVAYRGGYEVGQPTIEWLIAWCYHSLKDAIQKSYYLLVHRFPSFRLEDKSIFRAGSIDMNLQLTSRWAEF